MHRGRAGRRAGWDGVYQANVGNVAGLPKPSVRLVTEPRGRLVNVSSVWLEKAMAAFGPTPSSWKR